MEYKRYVLMFIKYKYDGIEIEYFTSEQEMLNRINELVSIHKEELHIELAAYMQKIYELEPVKVTTQFRFK